MFTVLEYVLRFSSRVAVSGHVHFVFESDKDRTRFRFAPHFFLVS